MKPAITIIFFLLLKPSLFSQFIDVSDMLGENNVHTYEQIIDEMPLRVAGGVAASDINNDSYVDFIYCLGDNQSLKLLINKSGESFENRTAEFDLDSFNFRASSPHFFNLNNDDFIDLIIGSVDGTPPQLFKNIDGERFELQENNEFDLLQGKNTITISSTDFNNDGLTDLFFSHWLEDFEQNHFWMNLGDGHFLQADSILCFYSPFDGIDFSHNAKFLDIDNDGFEDLLLCSDFGTSQVWLNEKGTKFIYNEDNILIDENGMGSALGDFDNDGDFDWFVTSVYDNDGILEGNWGGSGNKFYVNDGNGNFREMSKELGIDNASWGWGTTFADLNNDSYLDLVVVNGWPQGSDQFKNDKLKIFMSEEGKYFTEYAEGLGINDTLQGRGISVFDYNKDGRLDILTSNYRGPVKLYKNLCLDDNNFLSITVHESDQNSFGVGVKIEVNTSGEKQLRLLSNSSNYVSQNPLEAHFGLKDHRMVDSIVFYWNDNTISKLYNIDVDQQIHVEKPKEIIDKENLDYILYPNPSQLNISVMINNPLPTGSSFFIINSQGSHMKNINDYIIHQDKTYFYNIDISTLPSGRYFFSDDKNLSIPFTKI